MTVSSSGRTVELDPPKPFRSLIRPYLHLHGRYEADSTFNEDDDDTGLDRATERLDISDPDPNDLPPKPQDPEEVWEELIATPDFRHDLYIGACVRKDLRELRWLFQEYSKDNFHLQVSDDGDNGVLYAATEENGLATVQWLHQQDASIDQCNHYGRTPLMEAALWGRHKSVLYLTGQGADWRRRDGNNMNALDLAMNTERNASERASRGGRVYREPADAPQQRSRIEHHLKLLSHAQAQQLGSQDPQRRGFSFFVRTPDGNLGLYRPHNLLLIPNGQAQKAFAELDRGPNYPLVNAMSGYTYPNWPDVLDNELWARRANDLRVYLELPRDIRLASHVEPQLLAYLLFHHNLVNFPDQDVEYEDLQGLFDGLLPYTLTPIITVNKTDFCPSCQLFFERFKSFFPLLAVQFRFVGENANGSVTLRQ